MDRLGHVVSAVRATDGLLGVLGNHDSASMVPPMEDLGIRVLLNETISYGRGEDAVIVTGVDDVHRFRTEEAHTALESAPDGFCIALVHSPEAADIAARRHRLYLTGHTHGGQICLPGGRPFATGMKSIASSCAASGGAARWSATPAAVSAPASCRSAASAPARS